MSLFFKLPALAGLLRGCRLLCTAALLSGGVAAASEEGAEIMLGSSAALSGPASALGQRYHLGARAAFEQLNKQGGIHGRRVAVDLQDDGYEPDRSETNTVALLQDARVLALFGYIGTPTSRVALPHLRRAGNIAFLGPFTGASLLWDERSHPNVFNVRASYQQESRALVRAIKDSGARRINVMVQADPFGRAGLEAMREATQAAGLDMVATATVKRNSTDVAEAAHTLVRQHSADAIFMVSTYETCAAFMRQAHAQGFRGRFYTLSFTGLEPLRTALQDEPELSGRLTLAQVVPDAEDRSVPVVAAYQRAMREAGERQFDSISLEGYLAARVMSEGLRKARLPLTRASLLRSLQTLGDLDLGGFAVHYREDHRRGSSYVALRRLVD